VLVNPANAHNTEITLRDVEPAARAIGLQIQVLNASTSREIDSAFASLIRERPDALFVGNDAFFTSRRVQLATLAARDRIPATYSNRDYVEAGGLMTYGTKIADAYRQVGTYAGRILKGAKPADLPVVQSGEDDTFYLDLCDKAWLAVRIDANGWQVVRNPPVKFVRRRGMLPLPIPVTSGSIWESLKDLQRFVNVGGDEFVLVVSWLLAALRDRGPYPVLFVWGEAGAAKSTLLLVLRALIDPNTAKLRAPPHDNRDLFIAATNAYLPVFDNLSFLPPWLSDTLARLATGGGFATRQLYTDDEEKLFDATRPVLLGAVENIVIRGDLADRALVIKLKYISAKKRRREREFWPAFHRAQPKILGALLTAVSRGLKALPEVKLREYPRMADFAEWATACERGLWVKGTFARVYEANRQAVVADIVEASLVGQALQSFLSDCEEWTGTATELLARLNEQVDEKQQKSKWWPKGANALSGKLTRLGGDLRKLGIEISDAGRQARTNRKLIKVELRPEEEETPRQDR